MTKLSLKRTIKHDLIKAWAEERKGEPAKVRGTTDALRIRMGADEPQYEAVSWDKWFTIFDEKELAFVYESPGYTAKIVRRTGKEDAAT